MLFGSTCIDSYFKIYAHVVALELLDFLGNLTISRWYIPSTYECFFNCFTSTNHFSHCCELLLRSGPLKVFPKCATIVDFSLMLFFHNFAIMPSC